jgi:type VI secretion system protein ImpK
VDERFHGLLHRVGEALSETSGPIEVTGYTDNIPTRVGGPYPSNWELSEDRAQAVYALMQPYLDGRERAIEVIGRAHENPRADNESREGRAANRRVEISVTGALPGHAGREL